MRTLCLFERERDKLCLPSCISINKKGQPKKAVLIGFIFLN